MCIALRAQKSVPAFPPAPIASMEEDGSNIWAQRRPAVEWQGGTRPPQEEWPSAGGHPVSVDVFLTPEMKAELAAEKSKDDGPLVHPSICTPTKAEHFKVGEAVLCIDSRDGQQWEATVLKLSTGSGKALVHYKGWGKKSDDWVDISMLSAMPCDKVVRRIQVYNKYAKWCSDAALSLKQKTPKDVPTAARPVEDLRAGFAESMLKKSNVRSNPPRTNGLCVQLRTFSWHLSTFSTRTISQTIEISCPAPAHLLALVA